MPSAFPTISAQSGEGAFNAAFVPSYSKSLETRGPAAAATLAGRLLTILTITLVLLTALAIALMPHLVGLLAQDSRTTRKVRAGGDADADHVPYSFVTLVTLLSGVLNANDRFAAPAAAPIFLNLAVVAALAVYWLFPTAGHAAAWGVAAAGVLELLLVMAAAKRAGCLPRPRAIAMDKDMRVFFRTLGPAVIGSAGVQIAMFADTIIASLLRRARCRRSTTPTGSTSCRWA